MADKAIHARLVVHDLDTMPPIERRRLISWLRSTATMIETTPQEEFSKKFTNRLWK